jgi:hypothetical protein
MSIVTSNIIQDWNRICLLSLHTLHLQTSIKLSLNAQTSETLLQRKLKLDLHSGCGCIVWLCACVHVCSVAQSFLCDATPCDASMCWSQYLLMEIYFYHSTLEDMHPILSNIAITPLIGQILVFAAVLMSMLTWWGWRHCIDPSFSPAASYSYPCIYH